jgi:metal-responsive CopG/Arc/MetJ family transcriptional regulator
MKTAVSIPNAVFETAEQYARHEGLSRSELYAKALAEYLEHHRAERVTEALDAVYGEEPSRLDEGLARLQADAVADDRDEW